MIARETYTEAAAVKVDACQLGDVSAIQVHILRVTLVFGVCATCDLAMFRAFLVGFATTPFILFTD